jgi:hypothetical protein
MDNTSLDDFRDGSDDSGGDDSEDTERDTAEGDETSVTEEGNGQERGDSGTSIGGGHDAVEHSGPPTSRWRPEGTACAVCAETAARLWHQDGRLVCALCKEWD